MNKKISMIVLTAFIFINAVFAQGPSNFEKARWEKHINTELHKTGTRKKRKDYKEPLKCDKCDYSTKNLTTMKVHKLNKHSSKEERGKEFTYYCKLCDFGTFSNSLFNKHKLSEKHIKHEKNYL